MQRAPRYWQGKHKRLPRNGQMQWPLHGEECHQTAGKRQSAAHRRTLPGQLELQQPLRATLVDSHRQHLWRLTKPASPGSNTQKYTRQDMQSDPWSIDPKWKAKWSPIHRKHSGYLHIQRACHCFPTATKRNGLRLPVAQEGVGSEDVEEGAWWGSAFKMLTAPHVSCTFLCVLNKHWGKLRENIVDYWWDTHIEKGANQVHTKENVWAKQCVLCLWNYICVIIVKK